MRGIKSSVLDELKVERYNDSAASFPIFSEFGTEIGRTAYVRDNVPRYIHNFEEESVLFNAQILPKLFYGKPLVIVEGIFDAVSLHQEGIPVVALLTNTIKKRQFLTIRKYTNKLVFWLDSDKDGDAGYERSISKIKHLGFIQQFVKFNCNLEKDPNSLLLKDKDLFLETIEKLKKTMSLLED